MSDTYSHDDGVSSSGKNYGMGLRSGALCSGLGAMGFQMECIRSDRNLFSKMGQVHGHMTGITWDKT